MPDFTGGDVPANVFSGGFFDYNDLATATTPIVVTGGAGFVPLTNDGDGANTQLSYKPSGMTKVWDVATDMFDWSELSLGDMVEIRLDAEITTLSQNTEIELDLFLGDGAGAYQLPWITGQNFKSTGTYDLIRFNGIYMGDANTLDNGGQFMISSDKTLNMKVNGWYCVVTKRG